MNNPNLPALLLAVENELHGCIYLTNESQYSQYQEMFAYQLGLLGSPSTRGKRIRPLLVLLTLHALGEDWHKGLPAAVAVELMHNFSLIHDDIQDQSTTRRGQDTVWVKWGIPLAINAGDAMLALASLSCAHLEKNFSSQITLRACTLLQQTCYQLTQGQFLDISFEKRESISLEEYLEMIHGKTCALLSTSMQLGAILAETSEEQLTFIARLGELIGESFQIQDDWLGIWGNAAQTGKSNESDLISRKKTYPILLGLEKNGAFYSIWNRLGTISESDVPEMIRALDKDGIRLKTEARMHELYLKTINMLDQLAVDPDQLSPLRQLIEGLIHRDQ